MSDSVWSKVTPEQIQIASTIYQKWLLVAKSTARIDEREVTKAIKTVYSTIDLKKAPDIQFFDSPEAILQIVRNKAKEERELASYLLRRIKIDLVIRPRNNIRYQLESFPIVNTEKNFNLCFSHTRSIAQLQLFSRVSIQFWSRYAWFLDFAYSVLGCYYSLEKWRALQLLVRNCGYIIPFQDICYVSDRPIELQFKNDLILHSENSLAVSFADGYQIFANNGIELSIT